MRSATSLVAAIEGSGFAALASRKGIESREKKWALYESLFPPRLGERVLDLGASAMIDIPGENFFLRRYPYPEQVTAVVLWGAERLRAAFPGVEVVEADGRDLPFADGSFDVVHSNAVVEHVGPRPEQERFVAELLRVGRAGFVTTPNRWFPIEPHSRLPLVGWLPHSWSTDAQHLFGCRGEAWLLGSRGFRKLFSGWAVSLYRTHMGGMTATLIIVFGLPTSPAT